jgi:hypothetical protein
MDMCPLDGLKGEPRTTPEIEVLEGARNGTRGNGWSQRDTRNNPLSSWVTSLRPLRAPTRGTGYSQNQEKRRADNSEIQEPLLEVSNQDQPPRPDPPHPCASAEAARQERRPGKTFCRRCVAKLHRLRFPPAPDGKASAWLRAQELEMVERELAKTTRAITAPAGHARGRGRSSRGSVSSSGR